MAICIMACHMLQMLPGYPGRNIYCPWVEFINGRADILLAGGFPFPWESILRVVIWTMRFSLAGWLLICCYTSFIWLITHEVIQTQSDLLALLMRMNSLRILPEQTICCMSRVTLGRLSARSQESEQLRAVSALPHTSLVALGKAVPQFPHLCTGNWLHRVFQKSPDDRGHMPGLGSGPGGC